MLYKSRFESLTILITIFFKSAINNAIDFKNNYKKKKFPFLQLHVH
jgi:hypothetical protein